MAIINTAFVALSMETFEQAMDLKQFFETYGELLFVKPFEVAKVHRMKPNSMLVGHRYLIPQFGKKGMKWSMKEFFEWQQIPVEQRKAEYERLKSLGEL